jgi:ATP-dependent Clp protease adapter protein ClpS
MSSKDIDLSTRRFIVCIDEIQQNFVFGDQFAGHYARTVTLSDGSVRTVELTTMIRDGMPWVEFNDTGGRTYMGLNGTTTNGKLMVQIRDLDAMEVESRLQSPVLSPDTSLIAFPEFLPPGFIQGIEVLNDNTTPMQFVVSVLSAHLGLNPEDAKRTMFDIHTRGGALLPTPSLVEAQRIAAQISTEAANQNYPLVCRPVCIGES